jgi:hypothetical protein
MRAAVLIVLLRRLAYRSVKGRGGDPIA